MAKLKLNIPAAWTEYSHEVEGVQMVGTCRPPGKGIHALGVKDGRHVAVLDGVVHDLDQRSVRAALGEKNALKLDSARRVTIYLEPDAIAAAKKLGRGNMSEGIRAALLRCGA